MKKRRLIPVLLLQNGFLVQSRQFQRYQRLGNCMMAVKRFSEWASDELIYLDISREKTYDLCRDDLNCKNPGDIGSVLREVSQVTHMPITVGGGITTVSDIEQRLGWGADKVAINSAGFLQSGLIAEAANNFGSQCIVCSVDYRYVDSKALVFICGGRQETGLELCEWLKRLEDAGAGEILLNSIDRDGMKNGYDLENINKAVNAVTVPVIACGGAGNWDHLAEVLRNTEADAVAAANIFHYSDQSVYYAKKHLVEQGLCVRPPEIFKI
jgi:cyclase